MEPSSIRTHKRGKPDNTNYRLLDQSVSMVVRSEHFLDDEECRWEGEGGACVDLVREESVEEINRQKMRLRGSRKQRAARAYIPKETIKVIEVSKIEPPSVTMAKVKVIEAESQAIEAAQSSLPAADRKAAVQGLLEDRVRLQKDVEVERLKEQMARILGLLSARKDEEKERKESLARLERFFNRNKPKPVE